MDIDSNCPYPLFGETTSHLTSKLNVMDGRTDRQGGGGGGVSIFCFNVENSIKREMRNNCFSKKIFFLHQLFLVMLEIAWNAKKTWNIEKNKIKNICFNI